METIRPAELQGSGSLRRGSGLPQAAPPPRERVNYSTLCFPFVFHIRSFCDFWGFTAMHKQNDVSRENSHTKYFWVISKPALPYCRQVLWFVCLSDYIKEVPSPTGGLPYYALSALSFSSLFTVVLSGVVFVLFFFKHREHLGLPLNSACFPLYRDRQHSPPFPKNEISDSAKQDGLWRVGPSCCPVPNLCWWGTCALWAGCTSDRNALNWEIWIGKAPCGWTRLHHFSLEEYPVSQW